MLLIDRQIELSKAVIVIWEASLIQKMQNPALELMLMEKFIPMAIHYKSFSSNTTSTIEDSYSPTNVSQFKSQKFNSKCNSSDCTLTFNKWLTGYYFSHTPIHICSRISIEWTVNAPLRLNRQWQFKLFIDVCVSCNTIHHSPFWLLLFA